MSDPIHTLLELNQITLACDEVQKWIDMSREAFSNDQYFQLVMDRKQAEIDDQRQQVELIKLDISSRN